MSTRRKFNFPLAILIRDAGLLGTALADPAYQSAMEARLGAPFIAAFPGRISAVTGGAAAQSSQTGDLSSLTADQQEAFAEMERLAAGARRSARLAFPGQETILAAEFQVGEAGSKALAAVIARSMNGVSPRPITWCEWGQSPPNHISGLIREVGRG
jgi:hypothetical protein